MLKESKVRSIPFTILLPVLTNPTTTADSCTLTLRYARVFSEFRATPSQPLHLPSIYIGVAVLGCYQVRNARSVRSWSSSGYAQLGLGCKRRKPSTSNPVGEDVI